MSEEVNNMVWFSMPEAWIDTLKVGVQVDDIHLIPCVAFWACSASVNLTSCCFSKCTKTERVSASKWGGSVIHEDIAVLVTILVSLCRFSSVACKHLYIIVPINLYQERNHNQRTHSFNSVSICQVNDDHWFVCPINYDWRVKRTFDWIIPEMKIRLLLSNLVMIYFDRQKKTPIYTARNKKSMR